MYLPFVNRMLNVAAHALNTHILQLVLSARFTEMTSADCIAIALNTVGLGRP